MDMKSKVYEIFGKHNVVEYTLHTENDSASITLKGNDYELSDFKMLETIFGTSDISMSVGVVKEGIPYDGLQKVARIRLYIENII